MKRNHRVIRDFTAKGIGTFQFDIETEQFDSLLVTWTNADDATAAPTSLIFCPTNQRRSDGSVVNNFPTPAALIMPVAGAALYLAFGPNCMVAVPLPSMMTFGVINPAGANINIRVEGDEHEALLESPYPLERSRA